MKKEDLIAYKKKLAELSEEENKLRDLYLKKLSSDEIEGPSLEMPDIDKTWLQYYDFDKYLKTKPKLTVYEQLIANNKDSLDRTAIEFFGSKISYKKLIENIHSTVKAMTNIGIKKGDYVSFCVASLPETAYSFYAMGYMGTVGIYMAPYTKKEKFISDINFKKSKTLVIMDKFYGYIKDYLKDTTIENVIIIPTLNSSVLTHITRKPKTDKEILWNDFIKAGKKTELQKPVTYEKDMPLSVVYSSGTTGELKGILLSHDSYQNSVQSYQEIGVDITPGQKLYQIIPTWSSTAFSTCLHLPLTYGCCVFMDPRFDANVFAKNISKKKINYAVGTASLYEGFENPKNIGKRNFSNFNYPFVGGTPITKKQQQNLYEIFKQHGCDSKIRTAYGRCEDGAAISTQTQKIDHEPGSVGIPLSPVNVSIRDEDNNELGFDNRGYIFVKSSCKMLGYYNNEKNINNYYIDELGEKWSKTNDIGYMSKKGELFVLGRGNDYSIINGEKVYNFDVKRIIMEDPDIRDCEVIEKTDKDGNNKLCLHIIFSHKIEDEDIEFKLKSLQEHLFMIYNNINMIPQFFKIRQTFPMAKSTKRDMLALKNEKDGFIEMAPQFGKKL